jgi:hypothetical protein
MSDSAEERKTVAVDTENRVQALIERVQKLENEKEALRLKLWRQKGLPSAKIAYAFLFLGGTTLILSIIHVSTILAFIGLTLSLWGGLFLFIKPVRFVRPSLIDSTAISSLTTIDRLVKDLDYKGKAVHLPPLPYFLKGYKGGTVYIHSTKNRILPPVEEIGDEKIFVKNPKGICLVPPGLGLVNLYEEELGKDFIQVDLEYLQEALPKLFITSLEIASDLEIKKKDNLIYVKITGSVFKDLCKEVKKLGNVCNSFGCPLCSSIACALTRALGKPIIIEKTEVSPDGNVIEAYYSTIEE